MLLNLPVAASAKMAEACAVVRANLVPLRSEGGATQLCKLGVFKCISER